MMVVNVPRHATPGVYSSTVFINSSYSASLARLIRLDWEGYQQGTDTYTQPYSKLLTSIRFKMSIAVCAEHSA